MKPRSILSLLVVISGYIFLGTGCTSPSTTQDTAPADGIYRLKELDTAPTPIGVRAAPAYPLEAKKKGITGKVLVVFIVDKEGNVIEAKAEQAPDPSLGESAVEAVMKWKFRPGMKNGQPAMCRMQIPLYFEANPQ